MRPASSNIDTVALGDTVTGAVVTPESHDYEVDRRLFFGDLDRHPAAIVRVSDAVDVVRVIEFATDNTFDFSVRSGGHSVNGMGVIDGAMVIDVRDLDGIDIDVTARTAWAGSGVTAEGFTKAAGEHGLAVGFGDTGSVGLGGITLGGGVGYLTRKYGLTIDSLLAAEIVTAAGEILVVDEDNNPDLFWAIRGGGGNFGVATRFKFALQPIDRIVGGMMILPADPETIAGFIAESQGAPEELTTIANVMTCPPMPFLPEEMVGQTVLMGLLAWVGDIAEGNNVVDRLRGLAEPLADLVEEMPLSGVYPPEEEEYRPMAVSLTGFTEVIGPEKVASILEGIAASDAPMRAVQIRALGGAAGRVPNDATAYSHRDRGFMINTASFYETGESRSRRLDWVRDLHDRVTEDDAAYVGFLADEGEERVRAAYPHGTWERLRQVKAKYDPENLFRHNQNIPPAE